MVKFWKAATQGYLIASLTASGNVDQNLSTLESIVNFDTDDTAAYGSITRNSNQFVVSKTGLYTFNLQPQITENSAINVTTIWCKLNGNNVSNSAIQQKSSGVSDTHVEPLTITLDLEKDDIVTFAAITSVLNGSRLDFTAATASIPAVPAVIIDIKGWAK